jgi:hypothetical protein
LRFTVAFIFLGEHADAAAAVEGHAELVVRRQAGKLAGELRALVLAGDDFAGTAPLALDLAEKPGLAFARISGAAAKRRSRVQGSKRP